MCACTLQLPWEQDQGIWFFFYYSLYRAHIKLYYIYIYTTILQQQYIYQNFASTNCNIYFKILFKTFFDYFIAVVELYSRVLQCNCRMQWYWWYYPHILQRLNGISYLSVFIIIKIKYKKIIVHSSLHAWFSKV